MTSIRKLGVTILIALVTTLASLQAVAAGHHQICYQDQWTGSNVTATFACRADDPAVSCTVAIAHQGIVQDVVGANSETKRVILPGTGSFTGTFTFSDGIVRTCGVSTKGSGATVWGPATQGSSLVGFTTDVSGLITTGVWTHRSNANATRVGQTLSVPYSFVAVGGGGTGAEVPSGALLYQSHRSGSTDRREWQIGTQDDIYAQAHDNDAFAIGLKIEGVASTDLVALIDSLAQSASSNLAGLSSQPNAGVVLPANAVALGGSIDAFAPPVFPPPPAMPLFFGQYATSTSPMLIQNFCHPACVEPFSVVGWTVESKDHGVSRPGWIQTELLALPNQITVGTKTYLVQGSVASGTAAVAQHPSVVVPGKRGEYALTGVGAFVNWRDHGLYGNLIWKLMPRPDIGGVEAASKDHGFVSPATITGFALGIKLVDPTSLPPPPVLHLPPGGLPPRP